MSDTKPPLTVEQLHEIGVRRKGDEDVKTLLWEIKRLRDENEQLKQDGFRDYCIISRCYQIARSLTDSVKVGALGMLVADLNRQPEGHPAKENQDSLSRDLLRTDLDVKPGDDDDY